MEHLNSLYLSPVQRLDKIIRILFSKWAILRQYYTSMPLAVAVCTHWWLKERYQSSIYRCERCIRKFYSQQSTILSNLSDNQRFMIIGAHLTWTFESRTSNFIGFSKITVSRFMTADTKLGNVPSAQHSSGRKSKLKIVGK